MSSLTDVDWLTVREAPAVTFRRSYIELPEFSYTGLTWLGASSIITQFNFTATSNFTIPRLPAMPAGANFVLCIRYRVGDVVTRYRLWSQGSETLAQVPLYAGQKILANFVLEVWSVEASTVVSLDDALEILTSIRAVPADYRVLTDYANSVGAEAYPLTNTNTVSLPATGLVFQFDAALATVSSGEVVLWGDVAYSGRYLSPPALPIALPTYTASNAAINNKPSVNLVVNSNLNDTVNSPNLTACKISFAVIKPNTYIAFSEMFNSCAGRFAWQAVANRPAYMYGASSIAPATVLTLGNWYIVMLYTETLTGATRPVRFYIDDFSAVPVIDSSINTLNSNVSLELSLNDILDLNFSVAEWLGYSTLDATGIAAVITYLKNKYATAIGIPLTFPTGSAWLDNP